MVTSSGLGPTRLICPASTFSNWGSSSMLQRRSTEPIRVIRGSALWVRAGPSRSAPSTIVLSLRIWKGLPSRPLRHCRYSTVPGDSSFIATLASSRMAGAGKATKLKTRSRQRLRAAARSVLRAGAASAGAAVVRRFMAYSQISGHSGKLGFLSHRSRVRRQTRTWPGIVGATISAKTRPRRQGTRRRGNRNSGGSAPTDGAG